MFVQYGARLLGVTYLAMGIFGFVAVDAVNPVHHQGISARYLLNLVAINELHNIIHLAFGVSGLLAARSLVASRRWGLAAGAVLLLLFVVGMAQAIIDAFPYDQSLLGLVPLNSPGHFLHLVTGSLAVYLGVARPQPASTQP